MISLRTDLGNFTTSYLLGMVVSDLVEHVKAENNLEIRGNWEVQETQTGRILLPDEVITDMRIYHLNAVVKPRGVSQPNIIRG